MSTPSDPIDPLRQLVGPGLSDTELAEKLGIGKSTISQWRSRGLPHALECLLPFVNASSWLDRVLGGDDRLASLVEWLTASWEEAGEFERGELQSRFLTAFPEAQRTRWAHSAGSETVPDLMDPSALKRRDVYFPDAPDLPGTEAIPIYGSGFHGGLDGYLLFDQDWLRLHDVDAPRSVLFRIVGDGMENTIFRGSLVLIDQTRGRRRPGRVYASSDASGSSYTVSRAGRGRSGWIHEFDHPDHGPTSWLPGEETLGEVVWATGGPYERSSSMV